MIAPDDVATCGVDGRLPSLQLAVISRRHRHACSINDWTVAVNRSSGSDALDIHAWKRLLRLRPDLSTKGNARSVTWCCCGSVVLIQFPPGLLLPNVVLVWAFLHVTAAILFTQFTGLHYAM